MKSKFKKTKVDKRKTVRTDVMARELEISKVRDAANRKFENEKDLKNLNEEQKPKEGKADDNGNVAIECLLFLKQKRVGESLGQTLVSSGADGKIRFWSVKDGSLCHVLKSGHPNEASVTCMTSDDPNNEYLFTGCAGGYVKVWSLKSLEKAAGQRLHRRFSVFGDSESVEEADGEIGGYGGFSTQNHENWAKAALFAREEKGKGKVLTGNDRGPGLGASRGAQTRMSRQTFSGRGSTFVPPEATKGGGGGGGGGLKNRRNSMVEADYVMPKVYEMAFWKAHTGPLVSIQHVGVWGGKVSMCCAALRCAACEVIFICISRIHISNFVFRN